MGEKTLMLRIKKVLKRFRILLRLKLILRLSPQRRQASRRPRSLSFNDRTLGLHSCLGDEIIETCSLRKLERSSSSHYVNVEDDIDKRSQIFIDNFRRRLQLEKQISLQLRYYRVNSLETEDEENSPC